MADGGPACARLYPRDLIDPWTKNPRSAPFDVSDILATLIEGGKRIEGRTITEALKLRREACGRYTALKGARRLMAAAIAGIEELPGEIVDWDDERALDEALIDEARRALTPLEEGRALLRLRERGLDDAAIARRAGRSIEQVRRRLALVTELLPEGQEALAKHAISEGLANRIARLSPAVPKGAKVSPQAQALAEVVRAWRPGDEPVNVRDAHYALRRALLMLRSSGFPLDDATLPGGACTKCPKRAGVQGTFFVEMIDDADTCTDAACFGAKRAEVAARRKAAATAAAIPIVDAPAELKKLYRHGGSQLAHDAPVVDLDERCDLVEPPAMPAPPNEGRRGGPDTCTSENGEHDFGPNEDHVREDEEDDPDERPAAQAGCEAWRECENCGAWEECDPPPWHKPVPRGWKPPTWREALGGALGAGDVKPTMVAVIEAGARDLFDKKSAVEALHRAGVIDNKTAKNEIREASLAKKPGELEKWQVDQKASEIAREQAIEAIGGAVAKKAANAAFWRFLAALCVRVVRTPSHLVVEALHEIEGKTRDEGRKNLLAHIAKADEVASRAIVVQLLAADATYGVDDEETGFGVACRFCGVDFEALKKAAAADVKKAAKEKAKKAADRAKTAAAKPAAKTKKVPKASTVAVDEEPVAQPADLTQGEHDEIAERLIQFLADDGRGAGDAGATESDILDACADDGEPDDAAKIRQVLADLVKSGALALAEGVYRVAPGRVAPGPTPMPLPSAKAAVEPAAPSPEESDARRRAEGDAARARDRLLDIMRSTGMAHSTGDLRARTSLPNDDVAPALAQLVESGEAKLDGDHYRATLTESDVDDLAKRLKIERHAGAQSCANIWGCIKSIRERLTHDSKGAPRNGIWGMMPSAGTDTVDLAILYLVDAGEIERVSGKGEREVFRRIDTVHFDGAADSPERAAVWARSCPVCGVKAGSTYCLSGKGKLGGGWFHRARTVAAPVPVRHAPVPVRHAPATTAGTPPPSLVDAVRLAAQKHKAEIREFIVAQLAATSPLTEKVLWARIDAHFEREEWYAWNAEKLGCDAFHELEERAAIQERADGYHRLDPSLVPCSTKACGARAGAPCRDLEAGLYHPARVRTARIQPALPGQAGESVCKHCGCSSEKPCVGDVGAERPQGDVCRTCARLAADIVAECSKAKTQKSIKALKPFGSAAGQARIRLIIDSLIASGKLARQGDKLVAKASP